MRPDDFFTLGFAADELSVAGIRSVRVFNHEFADQLRQRPLPDVTI